LDIQPLCPQWSAKKLKALAFIHWMQGWPKDINVREGGEKAFGPK
jgi:hypothetical protein